jgi:alpha-mannosidase
MTVRRDETGICLESAFLRAVVGPDGEMHSLAERDGPEMLSGPTRLALYPDRPMRSDAAMQAWDVDQESFDEELPGAETLSVRVLAGGPLVARVAIRQRIGGSEIVRIYHLDAAAPYIRVEWEADWQERERWLKWWIPVTLNAPRATTGIPLGADERPTHGSTPWDAAKFEVYAHEFADVSEGDRGLAVLNRDRYGHAFRNGAVGVTLLRSPGSPDPEADRGSHRFELGLYPHPHGYAESDVAAWAAAFSRPPRMAPGGGRVAFGGEWFSWSGAVGAIVAIKAAEDQTGYVVRLAERTNRRGRGVLRLPSAVRRVVRTNALEGLDPEDRPRELSIVDRAVEVEIQPFEIITLVAYPG